MFLCSVKNACVNYREFNLEVDLVGVTHTRNTIKICLKRIGHGAYKLEEKEVCWFAEGMS